MKSTFDETRFRRLYSTGMNDKAIGKAMGFAPSYIKTRRQRLQLEANTLSTGILGRKVSEFLEAYRMTIINNTESGDSGQMIHLCQNCPFEDCLDCVELFRQREKTATKRAA